MQSLSSLAANRPDAVLRSVLNNSMASCTSKLEDSSPEPNELPLSPPLVCMNITIRTACWLNSMLLSSHYIIQYNLTFSA